MKPAKYRSCRQSKYIMLSVASRAFAVRSIDDVPAPAVRAAELVA